MHYNRFYSKSHVACFGRGNGKIAGFAMLALYFTSTSIADYPGVALTGSVYL